MYDLDLKGAEEFFAAAKKLKEAGATGLTKELNTALRKSMTPARQAVKAGALSTLPSSGGLARIVARSKFRTRRTRKIGIALKASGGPGGGAQLGAMDEGWLRHPVYGRGGWARQSVTPGWFSKPMQKQVPRIRRELGIAVGAVLHDLAYAED